MGEFADVGWSRSPEFGANRRRRGADRSRTLHNGHASGRVLLEHGALWKPDDARAINDVRRNLMDCDAEVSLEVIEALMKHNACTRETIEALLKTPAMKRHVVEVQRKFDR